MRPWMYGLGKNAPMDISALAFFAWLEAMGRFIAQLENLFPSRTHACRGQRNGRGCYTNVNEDIPYFRSIKVFHLDLSCRWVDEVTPHTCRGQQITLDRRTLFLLDVLLPPGQKTVRSRDR